ncbi:MULTISPECIES: HD-GYP domain-containing protein [Bacillus cereus group]|uniref:HD-GYP domain-containing protein n=1 Tax=Bacillus cereus group TaxID=86661 RepID=UPI0009D26A7B|nr:MULTISPECIES: HD-GYP domain-containing protein [Bacillus cereus group]MCU5387732.1 HD-GYP domain-containing protein [Bacillus paranthracis]MCX3321357.1 HD-GYP domain-containing protein [Bacillus paranthracis]ONG86803.1 HD family phosphohydrolase [Bacillus cereus]
MMKGIKNIETKEPINMFLFIPCSTLLFDNIYQHFILGKDFTLEKLLFELVFLFIFISFFLCNKCLQKMNKQMFTKYIFLGVSIIYLLAYDLMFIRDPGSSLHIPYLECFLVISAPLFLSIHYLLTVSICMVCRFLIAIYYFEINYPISLILLFLIIFVTSFFVFLSLKFLVQKIKASYEKQMKETALSIMRIMELKDQYTKGHSERVANYATILAKETNEYDDNFLKQFHFICLLHDIGKIGIPDEVLKKASSLTEEEYNLIKTHPQLGLEVFKNISLIKGNEDIILSHHERWDGKGYPQKLKGNQIPLCARIVAIADAFDAMTSSRAYRSALSPEEAYRRIIEGSGTQFDPSMVEIFKKVFPLWEKMVPNSFR